MKKIKLYDYQQVMLRRIVEAQTSDKGRGMFFDKTGRKVKRGNSVMVPAKYEKLELLPRGRVRISYAIGKDQVRYLKELFL